MKNKELKAQDLANQVLTDFPQENAVFITEDNQVFFKELDALNHKKKMDFKEDPQAFFRQGFEPEDTKTLQQDLDIANEKTKS